MHSNIYGSFHWSLSINIASLIGPWIIWKLLRWLRIWTTSVCIAPGSTSMVSSLTCSMNITVLVTECQIVVALTLNVVVWAGWIVVLWVVILGIIVLWVIIVSTVAAAIVVGASTKKILKTKESGSWFSLARSLSLSSATITSTTSTKVEEFSVGAIVSLSSPSTTWIVSLVTSTTIKGSAKDGSSKKSSTQAKDSTINKLTASTQEPCVCVGARVGVLVTRTGATWAAGTGAWSTKF